MIEQENQDRLKGKIVVVDDDPIALKNLRRILEKDGQIAAQEAREKVASIRGDLPDDIEEPVIARFDPQSAPIISLTVSGKRPLREITTFTKDKVKKRLESLPGVGSVTLVGGFEREIGVFLDIDKMESYQISIDKVKAALQSANLEIPGGRIDERGSNI